MSRDGHPAIGASVARPGELAERLRARVLDERRSLVALCHEMVAIPSPNPPGDTTAFSAYVTKQLKAAGLATTVHARDPRKPNIVSIVGRPDGPRIVLCGHMDTFPRPDAWAPEDAYRARVEDGRIYGTGVGDMRAGLAIMLTLAKVLARADIAALGSVVLVFTSDEESGGALGAELVLQESDAVRGADACLIGDQSGVAEVGAAEKGFCWLRVRTTAEQGHAAYRAGSGAIVALAEVARALADLVDLQRAPPELGAIRESDIARRVTVNVGRVSGGRAPNLVASSAAAELDVRFPVGMTVDEVLAAVRSRLATADVQASLEVIRTSEPAVTAAEEPVVAACVEHVRRVTGSEAQPVVRVGASDGRLFRHYGIPTAVCGPTPHNFAGVDEFVEVRELLEVAQVHAGVVGDLLEGSGVQRVRAR
jgi:succinyl-diaminopimelate desuccinylase